MVPSKVQAGPDCIEDTWVGRLMFPAGNCKDNVYVPKNGIGKISEEKVLDTPTVFLVASGLFYIYWCQELTAVILRVGENAGQGGFEKALSCAVEACTDNSVHALILDYRENSSLRSPLSTEELGLEAFGRHIVAVHPGYAEDGFHDHVHLYGFSTMTRATAWLRAQQKASVRSGDIFELIKGNSNAKLVEANYCGSAYWLVSNRTLVMLYSGHAEDNKYTAQLWVAISAFLEHLRAQTLIVDVRHMVKMHTALTQEISTAIEYLKSRGANKFILVGSRRVKPGVDDAVEAYFEIMSHAPGGVLPAKNMQQALSLAVNPQRIRALNS